MNIVVIGASRGIGLATVKAALAAGHSVRAMSRSGLGITHPRVTTIMGDATGRADLATAIAGGDVVIQALGLLAPCGRSTAPARRYSPPPRGRWSRPCGRPGRSGSSPSPGRGRVTAAAVSASSTM